MWTASAATSWLPSGRWCRSSGWMTRSFTPSRPGALTVATTVPITRASCMTGYPRTRAAKRASAAMLSAISAWRRGMTRHARPAEAAIRPAPISTGALEPRVGGLDDRRDGGSLDDAQRLPCSRAPLPADGGHEVRVGVGKEDDIEDRGSADLAARSKRLLHVAHLAADEDEVLPRVDRAGPDHVDRGALGQRVPGLDPGGDRIQLEKGEGRLDGGTSGHGGGGHRQTIRSAPTTVIRRSREKVRGRVRPSPDGLAIEKEVKPSPPSPRPA